MKKNFKDMPQTEKIIREMCKRVGANFNKIDFKKKEWFMKYHWTESQQEDFKNWLIQYWKINSEARHEMLASHYNNQKMLERAASWFMLDFGWKLEKNGIK